MAKKQAVEIGLTFRADNIQNLTLTFPTRQEAEDAIMRLVGDNNNGVDYIRSNEGVTVLNMAEVVAITLFHPIADDSEG